ncbi:DNA mismatch repair endonuclease MutL [Pseudoalteromonas sp. SG45-5]|uniref:DNA mismatch repair endonuclease MutL n=1 Tax=unclassified Pseudoalteromonas TaxID=194690 RepID=UPI0015FE301D|nr:MULTISPECIES: DNA mismatch repair endonuclease MutL [unclassified Pseudoalteromonas]MBB1387067.1 DNA mismatch repair endonuclease MutL [Pseudoalteromonas sp. SG45-5]MBB1395175.1 DNA mismatch repair endonuclease MutL [Pseudoalteromonas sp. SG44-4]MBB1447826.1 DNA mismatch repair endonuclease MutL [Pseudoalteromonas sp. SG41-6]
MNIEILPARLANQIAAGEVVERPASVVKELVENSLDAGATRIQIDIERGGHKLIRIRDNGSGISKDELTLALSRHATSKLKSLDDLENICSLGFRGEALASISSVSRLTLSSKPKEQETAWQAFAEGRDMAVQIKPVAHPDGTTIEVKDLFFNTPARRKFLRTEKTEFSHIDELIKRIALSRFDVSITLTHNEKVVRQYRAKTDPTQAIARVAQVAGKAFVEQGLHIQSGEGGLQLHGWVLPVGSANTTQYTYVNNRMMRDKLILHAIRQAFEEVSGTQELPGFVIYIDIDPRQVDVNVHPAKHEVRFHQGRLIHDFILQAIKQVVVPLQGEFTNDEPASAENEAAAAFIEAAHSCSNNVEAEGIFDYPKSQLQPAQSRGADKTSSGASRSGHSGAYRATPSTSHHDVNAFYQGVSEQHAAHFDNVANIPVTPQRLESAHNVLKVVSIISVHDGVCVFSAGQQLYCSHFKYALVDDWHNQIKELGNLEGKALLLPVRVNLPKEDCLVIEAQQSWFTLLGFELVIEKQFVMVKKLPACLYLLDVSTAVDELLNACKAELENIDNWLEWQLKCVPTRFYASNAFLTQQLRLQNNPQTIERLRQKAVKIELNHYLTQLD